MRIGFPTDSQMYVHPFAISFPSCLFFFWGHDSSTPHLLCAFNHIYQTDDSNWWNDMSLVLTIFTKIRLNHHPIYIYISINILHMIYPYISHSSTMVHPPQPWDLPRPGGPRYRESVLRRGGEAPGAQRVVRTRGLGDGKKIRRRGRSGWGLGDDMEVS